MHSSQKFEQQSVNMTSRGMVAWMCGYERKIANRYWIYVSENQPALCERSLTDKPKKGRCTTKWSLPNVARHLGLLVALKDDLSSGIFCLRPKI